MSPPFHIVGLDRSSVNGAASIESPSMLFAGFTAGGSLQIGAYSYSWSHLPANVASVGRYCSIADGVLFGGMEHPLDWLSTSSFTYDDNFMRFEGEPANPRFKAAPLPEEKKRQRIRIGNDVWIGARSNIRGGVHLGDGCVIGTDAVVTKDVAPYAVVVGNPGRVIKHRFDPETVAKLLALQWWRYSFHDLADLDPRRIHDAIDRVQALVDEGMKPFDPPTASIIGNGAAMWLDDASEVPSPASDPATASS